MKIQTLLLILVCAGGYYEYLQFERIRKDQEATIADLRRQLGGGGSAAKTGWLQQRLAQRVNPLDAAPSVQMGGTRTPASSYDLTGRYWVDQSGLRHYAK